MWSCSKERTVLPSLLFVLIQPAACDPVVCHDWIDDNAEDLLR
jgi:hypothetical protein